MLSGVSLTSVVQFCYRVNRRVFVCCTSFVELQAEAGHVELLSMGSLMAGWDKDPWNEQKVMTRSKTSLTKEEIQDFWRKRQLDMEEHLKAAKAQTSDSQSEKAVGTPNIDIPQVVIEELEQLPEAMSPDWWTRSNSAFLNSPPDFLGKRSNYTAQYEVAKKATQTT